MADKRLTREQADKLVEQIGPMMLYLGRLQRRMEVVGMQNNELYPLVAKTYNAIHELRMAVHYQGVGHGVGRTTD